MSDRVEEMRARVAAFMAAGGAGPRSGAERMRAKRARDCGDRPARTPKPFTARTSRSKFHTAPFVAIDGEGVSEGPQLAFRVGKEGTRYTGQAHYMNLLAASSGQEIACAQGRLGFLDCMEFLFQAARENRGAIMVAYGMSYDVTQMLVHDLSKPVLDSINAGVKTKFVVNGRAYKVLYRPRKCLQVWRWRDSTIGYILDSRLNSVEEPCSDKFTLWDVLGFFQQSFVATMEKWLGSDHADYRLIESMKGQRDQFTRAMLPLMREYNQAECRALVSVMELLRDAIAQLGLSISRWDGAGAISAALLKKHRIKDFKNEAPGPVFDAARCAFSGGHIEVCKFGVLNCTVHHYDINSAYPAIIQDLPDLSSGQWNRGRSFDPPPGFTLVKVRYGFASNMAFYPLFHRSPDGSIGYPQYGCGWFWHAEFSVARDFFVQHGGNEFEVLDWWSFTPANKGKPFSWVPEYYDLRKDMVRRIKAAKARTETGFAGLSPEEQWITGGEKVIKLGANGLYGKSAQQLGGTAFKPPPYFQLEWAGYITAGCRSVLMRAAMQDPSAIVSFATDGLFSLRPLALDCPAEKQLGAWEYTRESAMVLAMAGVYWLWDGGEPSGSRGQEGLTDPPKHAYSRGFDKAAVQTPRLVLEAWKQGKDSVPVPLHRLVTMGSACASSSPSAPLWQARGMFLSANRRLDISGRSHKRDAIPGKVSPWKGPVSTRPRQNWRYLNWLAEKAGPLDDRAESAPYPIDWLDTEPRPKFHDTEIELQLEQLDADDSLW